MKVLRLGMVVMALSMPACSEAISETKTITIANESEYNVEVHVTDDMRVAWLPLAVIQANSTRSVEQVIDQGDVWTFRFLHWGDTIGELVLGREELEGNDWRIEIPADVEQELERLGRPVSP